MSELLSTKGMGITFGGLKAVDNVDITINSGEIVGLIGPNGAGKTTCFNMITGVYTPSAGDVLFSGQRINGQASHTINKLGIARTFQNIRLFKNLSVLDNVRIALHREAGYGLLGALLRGPGYWRSEDKIRAKALHYLNVFGLADKARAQAGSLPYGDQRKLEIVRAMATNPKLLLLDEPAAGMNPQETAQLTELVRKLRSEFKLTVLLIEHDMSLVMNLCERIYVLDYGKEIAHGSPRDIQSNPQVIKAYLGES